MAEENAVVRDMISLLQKDPKTHYLLLRPQQQFAGGDQLKSELDGELREIADALEFRVS